jgi:hypothetical protein
MSIRSKRVLPGMLAVVAATAGCALASAPLQADPAADLATLFSDLCIESGLTTSGLEEAFKRVTHGETPLEKLETDREQIYSREFTIGKLAYVLQAVAPASRAIFRNCRVSAEFPDAAEVEAHLLRMFPKATRTRAQVQRTPVGKSELLSISVQWLEPRPGIGVINLTVEVFAKQRKATITAVPAR